jgi:Transcription factor e(y)2
MILPDLLSITLECGYFVKLIESGEKEKLTELLRQRLIECGWRDDMKSLCRFLSF